MSATTAIADLRRPGTAPTSRRPANGGAACAILVFFGVFTGAAFAVPAVVQVTFPVGAVVLAYLLLRGGRPAGVIELALWLFIAAPFVRRVADWRGGYHPTSLILLAAPLVCLTGVVALGKARYVRRWVAVVFLIAALCFAFATIVGLLQNGFSAAGTQFAQWVSPLFGGLLVLLAPARRSDYFAMLRRVTRWGLLLIGAYGLIQFFYLPAWDAAWMTNVSDIVNSIGTPQPLNVRVFSVCSSPGPMASVLTVLLLLAIAMDKSAIDYVAVAVALASFGLSQVRSAWLVFVVALAVLAVVRRVRLGRFILLVVAGVAAILLIGGPLATTISDRFTQTTQAGSQDTSYQARTTFQARQLPGALSDPHGDGLGSSGTAARSGSTTGQQTQFANTDSGYLEDLHVFGGPLGVIFIGVTIVGGYLAWRQSLRGSRRQDDRMFVVLATTLLTVPIVLYFGPSTTEVAGLLFWAGIALAGHTDSPPRSDTLLDHRDGSRPAQLLILNSQRTDRPS